MVLSPKADYSTINQQGPCHVCHVHLLPPPAYTHTQYLLTPKPLPNP